MKENKIWFILFAIFVSIIIIGFAVHNYWVNKIHDKPHSVVCATITETYRRRGGAFCRLKFTYKDEDYYFPKSIFREISISEEMYNNFNNGYPKILIVFPVNEPEAFLVIKDQYDFIKFNIVAKDTLGIRCN